MSNALDLYRAGSTEPWTVDVICAMAVASDAHILVETGTFEARTTRQLFDVLGTTNRFATIYSIESDRVRYEAAAAQDWSGSNVHVVLSNNDALLAMDGFADNTVDFVFLDDDHTADHVALEIREAKRILKPGGICCLHDAVGPFGIGPLVIAAGGIVLPFVKLHSAGGLGVIVK